MIKTTLKTTTKLLFLTSSLALGSTIPVTGFGSFSLGNFYDTFANVCLTGQDLSLCANGVRIGPAPPTVLAGTTATNPYLTQSNATLDSVTSNHYAFSVGGGQPGYVDVLDAAGNVMASTAISGEIHVTNFQEFGTRFLNGNLNDSWWARGTFTIGAAQNPEPAEWGLVFLALLGIIAFRKIDLVKNKTIR